MTSIILYVIVIFLMLHSTTIHRRLRRVEKMLEDAVECENNSGDEIVEAFLREIPEKPKLNNGE